MTHRLYIYREGCSDPDWRDYATAGERERAKREIERVIAKRRRSVKPRPHGEAFAVSLGSPS